MDEGTTGMNATGTAAPGPEHEPVPETAAELEQDIEQIRNHLSDVAGELDRRRHRVLDLPGQVRKHAKPIAIGTVALAALGLGVWWWRSRSRRSVPGRLLSLLPDRVTSGEWAEELRARLAEAIHPSQPAHPVRSSLVKISTASAAAAASALGRHFAGRLAAAQWPVQPDETERTTGFSR